MVPESLILDVETFSLGYKIALQQELAAITPNVDLNLLEIDKATGIRVLEDYALRVPDQQQWIAQVWRDCWDISEDDKGIKIIEYIENFINTFRYSPIMNKPVDSVIVNGKPMDTYQIELLMDCYCEITGYHFKREQDYNLLTDIVRAIDFIAKGGRLKFEFEEETQEQFGFNLVSNPPSLEFLENNENKFQINDIAQAKAFVEEPSQATVIANIIQELSEEKDPEIKTTGKILSFIFNYQSSPVILDLIRSRMRKNKV